jgi:hypothetical protein
MFFSLAYSKLSLFMIGGQLGIKKPLCQALNVMMQGLHCSPVA